MKRIATLLLLSLLAVGAFAQVALSGVSWVGWDTEPVDSDPPGYAVNPFENPVVVIPQAPPEISPALIVDAATFDMAWGLLGDAHYMDKIIQDPANGDPYDLVDGVGTFGASWKGVHDGANLYIFSKYVDTNAQLDAGSHNYEVMVQPTSHVRHEPSFLAAADSAEEWRLVYENQAYARYVELGGGKAKFQDGLVTEYAASIGLNKSTFWKGFAVGGWGDNVHGLEGLAMATHFWDVTDGVIRSVLVMPFDGVLDYPADPEDLDGDYTAVEVGDVIAFDIKSRGTIAENAVEYHWSSDQNNCYASNYYAGHVTLSDEKIVIEGIQDRAASMVKVFVYNDQLYIDGIESVDVKLYSITGSLVKSAQNVSTVLDLSDVIDGIYFVKLQGIASGFKVVK